jgi:hypothetical protein
MMLLYNYHCDNEGLRALVGSARNTSRLWTSVVSVLTLLHFITTKRGKSDD